MSSQPPKGTGPHRGCPTPATPGAGAAHPPAGGLSQKPRAMDAAVPRLSCPGVASAPLCPQRHKGQVPVGTPGTLAPCTRSSADTTCADKPTLPGGATTPRDWPPRGLTQRTGAFSDTLGRRQDGLCQAAWVAGRGLLPSTQAGRALVVPAICPFLQAQRAVCRAIVLRGWLLSRSRVTISQVPAAS